MTALTAHFSVEEWTSRDGVPYPVGNLEDDGTTTWLDARLRRLANTLEVIRDASGGEPLSLTPNGGYRTQLHQQRILDAHPEDAGAGLVASATTSQHPQGRAADVHHARLSAAELHALILRLFQQGKLPDLGGLGLYPTFVHVDVRPRPASGHLAQWGGTRPDNNAAA